MTNPNQSELGKLRAIQYTLEEEVGELHHESRQVRDGLERVGGVSRELDQKARQIQISIRLCEKELKISLDVPRQHHVDQIALLHKRQFCLIVNP